MNKRSITLLLAAVLAVIFSTSAVYSGDFPEKVTLDTKGIKGDKYQGAVLSHKKHSELEGVTCGTCHHDDKGKALDLKAGDSVQKCVECHSNLTMKSKEKNKKGTFYSAFHNKKSDSSCLGCHKNYNKKHKLKKTDKGYAPASGCTPCHKKN